jgi:hypothetical protein
LYQRTIDFGGHPNERSVTAISSAASSPCSMLKIWLYHKLGKLPVPEIAHEYF